MSEQENNKMEAWLKAYRQQRLDQWNEAPVELDEPTRAMLMAEVRRQKTAAPVEATTAREPNLGWLRWAVWAASRARGTRRDREQPGGGRSLNKNNFKRH